MPQQRAITDISRILREYKGYLTLQRGLSANTARAYRDDVDKLISYLPYLAQTHHQRRPIVFPLPENRKLHRGRPLGTS